MQREEVTQLPFRMRGLADPYAFIAEQCRGRSVLNVGATGTVDRFLDGRARRWLHEELSRTASRLVGVDIDPESIGLARARGIDTVRLGDCTTMQLDERFERIVFSEVIEHIETPGAALRNLLAHLAPDGRIYVTTPNPTYFADVAKAVFDRAPSVYYDHVCAFYPENLVVLCSRCGGEVIEGAFFSFPDDRPRYVWKSRLLRTVGRLSPRLHAAFVLVVRARVA